MELDAVKTKHFWEEAARGIGTRCDAFCAVMVTDCPIRARYRHRMERDHLFRLTEFNKSMAVLDLGCGVGRYSFEFAKRCNSVLAIDYAPAFIEYASKAAEEQGINNITFRCQSITEYSYLKKLRFDVIHLGGVLMYMTDAFFEDLIHQLKQHLHRDGLLIARDTIALKQRMYGATDNPCIFRTQDEYLKVIQNNGFALKYINYNMVPPLPCNLCDKLHYLSPRKSHLLKNCCELGLSLTAKVNLHLLKHKWIIRLFIDPCRKTKNITTIFCHSI